MDKINRAGWLKAIRIELGYSQKEMAEHLGIAQPTYSYMERGEKSSLSIDYLSILIDKFDVNPYYLINGELPQFIENGYNAKFADSPVITNPYSCILVPVTAQAGYINSYDDELMKLPEVVIPGINGQEARVFEISGDSMDPILLHGDYVACTRVDVGSDVRDGLVYVVVSRTQGIAVKYLHIQQHSVECFSENPTHAPFHIPLDEVRELWEVRIRITRHVVGGRFKAQHIDGAGGSHSVNRLEKLVSNLLQHPRFKDV